MTFVFSIACAVAAVQILLSLVLVFHKHNLLAIVSELATSTGLTFYKKRYSGRMHFISMVLQLVDCKVHANTPHIGGYSIWGADN